MVNIPPVKQTNFSYASKYQLQLALSLGMGACVYFPLLSTLGHIRLEPVQAHPRWHTCVTVFWHLEGLVSLASSILSPSGSYNFSTSFYNVPWALHVCGGGVELEGWGLDEDNPCRTEFSNLVFDSTKCIIIVDFHGPWSCLMDKMIGTGRLWNTITVIWWRTSN